MIGSAPSVAIYGRTYWDAEVEVNLDSLGTGKGKRDVPVRVMLGGWACNAVRALSARFGDGEICAVTVCSALDLPRLRAQLPATVRVEAIDSGEGAAEMPPVAVIVNPSHACRLLRDPMTRRDPCWQWERVSAAVAASRLHLVGRVPVRFARAVVDVARANGGRVGWVGGDSLPPHLERDLDAMCVNSEEAGRLLGASDAAPSVAAAELLRRTNVPDAVRVVTGGNKAPTAVAVREASGVRCYEASSMLIPRQRITRLKGVGDAFASTFLAANWFDASGSFSEEPRVEAALAEAQSAAESFITQEWP